MEPQDVAGRELQTIKRRLCYISSTVCALCLVCFATTLALFLSHRTTQGNCVQYPCRTTTYAQLKWCVKKKNSTTLQWNIEKAHGFEYEDGNLTILSDGLYFINCRLHFLINECVKNKDLSSSLLVNGRPEYEVLNTLTNTSSCRTFRDQHLSRHIQLNKSDNLSVHTNDPQWLNDESLANSIVLEVVMV